MNTDVATIAQLLSESSDRILARWRELLEASGSGGAGRIKEAELNTQTREFLAAFGQALAAGAETVSDDAFKPARTLLAELSRSRAAQGFSPAETATFTFSLKEPVFEELRAKFGADVQAVAEAGWRLTLIVDQLGLHTMEVYQKTREDVVRRQQEEIAELSTPVVKLWDGIIALPLIGTLDSARTQVVMENSCRRSWNRAPTSRSSTSPACRPSTPSWRSTCSRRSPRRG